jgi:hypothetical protein
MGAVERRGDSGNLRDRIRPAHKSAFVTSSPHDAMRSSADDRMVAIESSDVLKGLRSIHPCARLPPRETV